MALMLLPFWTDGCIGSMEGLFFEASATTPYHFLTSRRSRPRRHVRCATCSTSPLDVAKGAKHLQLLGVKYYMAFSPAAVEGSAAADQDLTEVATSGPWVVFEVADTDIVTPLTNQPVVVDGRRQRRDVMAGHVRGLLPRPVAVERRARRERPEGVGAGRDGRDALRRPRCHPVAVSNIKTGDDRICFDVDRSACRCW